MALLLDSDSLAKAARGVGRGRNPGGWGFVIDSLAFCCTACATQFGVGGALPMTRDVERPHRKSLGTRASDSHRASRPTTLACEPLEDRLLLTSLADLPTSKKIHASGAIYTVSLSGPGTVQTGSAGGGTAAINLFGTTPGLR